MLAINEAWREFRKYRKQFHNDLYALTRLEHDIQMYGLQKGIPAFEQWLNTWQALQKSAELAEERKKLSRVYRSLSREAKYGFLQEHIPNIPGLFINYEPQFENHYQSKQRTPYVSVQNEINDYESRYGKNKDGDKRT